jgi:WD40 repeat protein
LDTIRIWKRADASGNEDGSFIEWKRHTGSIYSLVQLQDGRLASGSRDKTIRIWNVDGTSIEWKGHTDSVYCLFQLHDGRIASGSNRNIRIWKRADASGDEDGTSIEWKGHTDSVMVGCFIPIYTEEDLQQGRHLLYELLKDYVIEDVKSIVYQYIKPL